MTLDDLRHEAAKLSPTERAELAEWLIESLGAPSGVLEMFDDDGDLDESTLAEIARRSAQVDRGEVQLIPGDEALAQVRAMLDRK